MGFFNFIDLKFDQLNNQINSYLRNTFSMSDELFSNASPFGVIVNVLKEFYQFSVLYQKNIVRNLDIDTVTNINVMRTLSRISGHNPTRSITATGTLKMSLKQGVNIIDDISGGYIKIQDKTLLKNKSNGLDYTIRFGRTSEIFRLSFDTNIFMNVVQGKYEEQTVTGTGELNQSFSINIPNLSEIDNFDVEVLYNGSPLTIKDSELDMLRFEKACYIRTGMNGGIDIYFGNGHFGFVPNLSSIITVRYLLTDGISGNILTPIYNDFKFITEVYDGNDNVINMDDIFDITIDKNIQFSSSGEGASFLSNILPNVSRNYVLATPSQYIYHLRRLELFSKINVYNTLTDTNYDNDNKVFLYLIPKISNYFNSTTNYFNIPLDVYSLDSIEIDKTITYLKKLGNITPGTTLEVIQPILTKYIMNVYIRKNEGYTDDSIKIDIISSVSDYLSFLNRDDRIVRSDLINTIESVNGVDSVNIEFVSKDNEDYHREKPDGLELKGLDPVFGDIIVAKNELAIIRGGWSDRNGTYYNESPISNGLSPINIIFVGITKK